MGGQISMLEAKNFTKESEQYQFFHKLWEFGTFASTCEHGKLYLDIAEQIIELLKNNDFKELKQPLNGFYKIMSTYWDVSTFGSNEDWKAMVQDMDKLCDCVSESQKKNLSNIMVSLSDYFEEQYKEYKSEDYKSPKR